MARAKIGTSGAPPATSMLESVVFSYPDLLMCLKWGPNSQLDYADGMKADLSPAAGLVVSFQTVPLGLEFAGFPFQGGRSNTHADHANKQES